MRLGSESFSTEDSLKLIMNSIECTGLSKKYGEFTALKDFNVSVEKGSVFGLLGPNGAGKSTTINILATLLTPSSGSAKILGFDVQTQAQEVRAWVGICSGASTFFEDLTSQEILNYYAMLYGLGGQARDKKVSEVIEMFGISEFKDDQFRELSTGMRQKTALAKSLLNGPQVWLLDEPTLGLDVEIAREVREIIRRMASEEDVTVLLTSHYLFEVEELCQEVAVINHGRKIAQGKPSQIKKELGLLDVISFTVNALDAKRLSSLQRLKGVQAVHYLKGKMVLKTMPSPSVVGSVVDELEKRKIRVRDLEVRKPTLEEAFLRLVEDA